MTSVRIRMSSLACLLVVAGMVATSCSGADPAVTSPSSSPRPTAASPVVTSPSAAAAVDASVFPTRWPIKHVVFLIKENRTFDNLFGTFPGARGVTSGYDHGVRRPLTRGTDQSTHEDIPHCYECCAGGVEPRRDGWVQPERTGGSVGLHAAPQGPVPELLGVGVAQRAVRQLLRQRAGAVVPEPPVLDRGAVRRRARQPASQARTRVPHVRVRCAGRTARGGRRLRGSRRRW